MKISELAKKIKTPTIDIKVKVGDKTEEVAFPQITVGDWKEIKKLSSTDMWEMLLSISSGVDEIALRGKSQAQREKAQRDASMELFKQLDHGIQLAMFHQSLKREAPEISEADVDRIISYGIEDRGQYMRAMMYFVYGLTPEAIAELTEDDSPLAMEKNQDTPSVDEQ